MRTIGLIGGMSPESTATYYKLINRRVRERLGGQHSARIALWSVDFADIVAMQETGRWQDAGQLLADAALRLQGAGADCIVIAANTMHKVADAVTAAVALPLLHIADATAAAVKAQGVRKPLLLATRYTMEQDFYVGRLRERHAIVPSIPNATERDDIQRIIFDELVLGIVTPESKRRFLEIVARARDEGMDGVIFGCTEIGMILQQDDMPEPAFDTAAIHVDAAVDFALA